MLNAPASPTSPPADTKFDYWIEAGHTEKRYWADLWRYRELFFILAWRDIAVRYKQTVVGGTWALLQPLVTLLILLFFGHMANFKSGDAPYPLLVMAGLLPWQFFANALSTSGQSVVNNANMISKVYFPRVIIPTSSVIVSLIDFFISLLLLCFLMVWFQFWPTWRILALPLFAGLAIFTAVGSGLLITALMVRYRDVKFIVPFIVQFGLYLSPIAFSSSFVREKFGETAFLFYSFNPLVCVIDGFRWSILGGDVTFLNPGNICSLIVAVLVFVIGVRYFRSTERFFADIV